MTRLDGVPFRQEWRVAAGFGRVRSMRCLDQHPRFRVWGLIA
jgi:hypothetical protein